MNQSPPQAQAPLQISGPTAPELTDSTSSQPRTTSTRPSQGPRIASQPYIQEDYYHSRIASHIESSLNNKHAGLVLAGLGNYYKKFVKVVEANFHFEHFDGSSPLLDVDFLAPPQVLVVGNTSTGKTKFIDTIASLPSKPTYAHTDKFHIIMGCSMQRQGDGVIVTGNATALDHSLPFTQLKQLDAGYLDFVQSSFHTSELLKSITFIDTPGISPFITNAQQQTLASHRQICLHFAQQTSMIILFFDATKLDLSYELRTLLTMFKPYESKIHVVINKVDPDLPPQEFIRIVSSCMWYLGRIFDSPDAFHVYMTSFGHDSDSPAPTPTTTHLYPAAPSPTNQSSSNPMVQLTKELILQGETELYNALISLPQFHALTMVDRLIKRISRVKTHALIVQQLKSHYGFFTWKNSKKNELLKLNNLQEEFNKVQRDHAIPLGHFPQLHKFASIMSKFEIHLFPDFTQAQLKQIDYLLQQGIPSLVHQVPDSPTPKPPAPSSQSGHPSQPPSQHPQPSSKFPPPPSFTPGPSSPQQQQQISPYQSQSQSPYAQSTPYSPMQHSGNLPSPPTYEDTFAANVNPPYNQPQHSPQPIDMNPLFPLNPQYPQYPPMNVGIVPTIDSDREDCPIIAEGFNPFDEFLLLNSDGDDQGQQSHLPWSIPQHIYTQYQRDFYSRFKLVSNNSKLPGNKQSIDYFLTTSQLPTITLRHLWNCCDLDRDGCLDLDEFLLLSYMIILTKELHQQQLSATGKMNPQEIAELTVEICPPSKRYLLPTPSLTTSSVSSQQKQQQIKQQIQEELDLLEVEVLDANLPSTTTTTTTTTTTQTQPIQQSAPSPLTAKSKPVPKPVPKPNPKTTKKDTESATSDPTLVLPV